MKKNQLIVWLIVGLLGWGALETFAGGGPCNYIVLYDQTDTNSIAVANYYQQVRDIPERNMVPYTFFPAGKTSYARTNLWDLAVYLRQVIQERGLTGRFNGIAVAGTVPLLGTSFQLGFQSGLYFSPGFTRWGEFTNTYNNLAYTAPNNPATREIRDDKPFTNGVATNVYWPVSFVGFTGVNGNTPEEVFALLDRSKAADGLRPDGVVYWPTNTNVRSTTREDEINDVSAVWKARGIRYLVSDGGSMSINTGCPDIAGVFGGTAQADCGISGNTYIPGAWADHLTSNGGNLNTLLNGQSSACTWIRAGAYGSSGTASEPYAVASKFPHAHIHTHLRAGASMAEAYWQSLSSPQEIVMVGDPLTQAWAQFPQVSISSPADEAILSGTVAVSASASTTSPDGLEAQYELAVDGHIIRTNDAISATWTGSGFSLNTATLADGWHELRVIAYNNNAIHTQGEDSRTVFVNNSSQSVILTGPSALEYTSNGTFTVNLSGIANATNVTLQANGRTLATVPVSGGSTNLSASLFGYQGTTKLYALAWLNNGKQVWSAPLAVALNWAPVPAINVTPGASIAQVRYFSTTTATNFDWDSTTPDAVTNLAGPSLAEGFKTAMKYRSFSIDTNVFAPVSYAGKPGVDSTLYFLAPTDALYEFMVDDTSITNVWMEVDGKRIRHGTSTSDANIKPVPVKLAAGFHPIRLRFQATAADYLADLWYRGGPTPGNINADTYSNYQVQRLNEFVCFGPAVEGNAAPVITNSPVSVPFAGKTTASLSVGAMDPDSTNALTYTWAKIDGPGKFLVNTNIVNSPTNLATFNRAGNYRLRVVISDGSSVATGEVVAAIAAARSKITLTPVGQTMRTGASVQFAASSLDQFGTSDASRPFVWSVLGEGTISTNGLYTAPLTVGTNKVVVSADGLSATNTVIVVDNFAPEIGTVTLKLYGDSIQCQVAATDDAGTNNLTYVWEPVGVQPGNITFPSNGTPANPSYGFFDRFGTYNLRVGVTDGNGATVWSTNRFLSANPMINATQVVDADGNNDGRIDAGETADLFVTLSRGSDYDTNTAVSAALSVTNTPGLSVVQDSSAYPPPPGGLGWIAVTNLTPFRISANNELIGVNPRHLVLAVTIGGASGELPFSLPGAAPYAVTESYGAAIVPGTNDLGLYARYYAGTNVALPFAYSFGGQSFTNVFVNGNGILQFSGTDIYEAWGSIPATDWTNFIAVHWDLLSLHLPGCGIFTSVSGTAPNRIFNIEWRAVRYYNTNHVINCEARLYEAEPRVDLVYGNVGNNGTEAVVGLQVTPESYTVYSEYLPVLTNGLQLSFIMKSDTGVPTARFTASPASGWAPLPVTFSDTSTGGITNRFWDFGDGTTTSTVLKSLTHTYTSAGTYTVGLTVSGEEGASTNIQADCVTVTVPVAPSAGFTLIPASGTVPLSVSFTDTSTGDITSRFWDFGDGVTTNTTATAVSHTYTSVGTNTVTLIVSGPVGGSTNTQTGAVTVTLPPPPVANFSASPVSGTAPLAVTFTDTSTGTITNRFWSFGDGATTNTTATSVPHTYTSAGTNTVQLIVSGPGEADTNTKADLISVVAAPALYWYEGYNYTADTGLRYAPNYTVTGSGAFATNRAGSLTYPGLPASTGGKVQPAGYRGANATINYPVWKTGNADTNLFASFIFNVTTLSTVQSNAFIFSIRNSLCQFVITNNAADPSKFNVGIIPKGGSAAVWYNNSGAGYAAGADKTYLIVMSYTNSSAVTTNLGSQLWINPPLGSSMPAAQLTISAPYVAGDTQNIAVGNGNGNPDPAARSIMYIDEVRVGPAWASVTPGTVSAPAPVITSALSATGTVDQVFIYQITADNSPDSFNATGLPAGLSVNTNSGVITGTPTIAGSNNVTISASSSGGTDSKTLVLVISSAAGGTDTDSDGIPDEWETQYFGGATNANPSALAANGVNTIYESYIAGLNPTNPASVLLISNFQPLTSQSILQWQSASGRVYSIYWATNLMNGFQPLETNILWPQNSWTDTVHGTQGGSFYRIKVQLGQ